jgi:LmbE family N-acetylglucosaminyl deacetylase
MVDIRRQEDQAALKIVGVKSHYLDVPDCIYRRGGEQDRWLYASEEALFRKLNVVENKLISDITQKLVAYVKILSAHSKDIVRTVAPLAIGNHVDHQLVRSAAERAFGADTLTYYQDFPYVLKKEQILAYETSADWHSAITELDERAINCKVAAIAAYESQISTFWENRQVLEAEVKAAVRNWGNGELFWRFSSIA